MFQRVVKYILTILHTPRLKREKKGENVLAQGNTYDRDKKITTTNTINILRGSTSLMSLYFSCLSFRFLKLSNFLLSQKRFMYHRVFLTSMKCMCFTDNQYYKVFSSSQKIQRKLVECVMQMVVMCCCC